MEKMEKVCPSCGKKCPPAAGFCTGCGTNIQAVVPTQTQAAAAMGQASAMAGTAFNSVKAATKGTSIMNFVPAAIAFCNIMCVLLGYWATIKSDYGLSLSFTFFELAEIFSEFDLEFIPIIFTIILVIDILITLGGVILVALKKTAGKVISIIGYVLTALAVIIMMIIFAIASSEVPGASIVPGASAIFMLLFSIAGVVCAALVKTGKKANPATGFNPYMAQQQFAPQQPYAPQQTQAYNPTQNYNNPNQF